MELIGKQIAIETILGQPPELHYPSWYAAQIEKLPPAPPEYLAEQAGILVTDADTISRQAAIDICRAPHMRNADCSDFEMAIMMLPPAQSDVTDTNVGDMIGRLAKYTNMGKLISESAFYEAIYKLPIREEKADGENYYYLVSIADIFEMLEKLPANNSEKPNSSDAISRQAAIEALDEQIKQCDKALSSFDISMRDGFAVKVERASLVAFRETLEYLPPAQLEIIRCKDCKYAEYIDDVKTLWCTECGQGRTVAPNDFCSYAEMREVTT